MLSPLLCRAAGRGRSFPGVRRLRTAWAAFPGARSGNVVILFAFLSLPILGLTGAAIDYGMATRLETKLRAATDATALALCQTPGTTTTAALQTQANAMMTGYMGASVTIDPLGVTTNPRQITLTTHIPSTALVGKFTGVTTIRPHAVARCATPLPKTFEIALVLDNTGSMDISDGTQTKMQALKTAASNFVDYVSKSDSFATGTRISIVPFAGAVALPPAKYASASFVDLAAKSRYHWSNVAGATAAGFTNRFGIFNKLKLAYSGWDWAGCFETLPYPLNVQDMAPVVTNPDSYYVPLFAPDEAGDGMSYAFWYDYSNRNASYNSYIDDYHNAGGCAAKSDTYANLESRACKYVSPRDASPYAGGGTSMPNGPNFGCTTKPLITLTTTSTATGVSTLKSLITSMAPLGSTNIHEGFMWGWRTLSPLSVFASDPNSTPPSAYGASTSSSTNAVNKIIILMTDGENSWPVLDSSQSNPNKSQYFAMGYLKNSADNTDPNSRLPTTNQNVSNGTNARAALDALTLLGCTNAKAAGVSIYTIGFSIQNDPIDQQGLSLLSACASASNQFFVANDANSLINAFNQIAASIGTLRLTQ